jgi:hypothetical protein
MSNPEPPDCRTSHDPDLALRRANIGARIEIEAQRRASDRASWDRDAIQHLVRRVETLEASMAGLIRILARAGLVAVDVVGAVTLRDRTDHGSLLSDITEVGLLAAEAIEHHDGR